VGDDHPDSSPTKYGWGDTGGNINARWTSIEVNAPHDG